MVSRRTGLIIGLTIGLVALFILTASTAFFLARRRRQKIKTTEEFQPSAPAAYTTEEQINQAVERRFAAEKASRTVQVVAEPIDTISIDSGGRDRVRSSPKIVHTSTSREVLDLEQQADTNGGSVITVQH